MKYHQAFFSLLTLLAFASGCDPDTKHEPVEPNRIVAPPFKVPAEYAEKKHQLIEADLDSNGYKEAVLLFASSNVAEPKKGETEKEERYDSLVVFSFDTTSRAYVRANQFEVERGRRMDIADVTGDGSSEVLVYTDGGGTSLTASRGLTILGTARTGLKPIYSFDEGDPKIITLDKNKSSYAVALSNEYGNVFSHAQNVAFIDSLIPLSQAQDTAIPSGKVRFFEERINELGSEYQELKKNFRSMPHDEALSKIYSLSVQRILYMKKIGKINEAKSFMSQEKNYWKKIFSEDLYDSITSAID